MFMPFLVYETAPPKFRGSLGALTQNQMIMGFIIAFSLGFGTPETDEEKIESNYWRIMMGVPIIIATV